MAAEQQQRVSALDTHPYASFLGRVTKPGRYLGGEEQQAELKPADALSCRFVLAFPDLYEIGMSHLGTRIIYDLINRLDDLECERAFTPWADMEGELRERGLPLVSLEGRRPLSEFDVVGVSLQYELSYSNVLLNLELGGIPLRGDARGDNDPIVLGGGPTATHPEPLAPFVDAFLVGEAEEVLPTVLRTIGALRRQGKPRVEVLAAVARITGMYVPRFYRVEEEPRTGLQVVVGLTEEGEREGVPPVVQRVFVRNLDDFPFPTRFPVPFAQAIFDRASVEITRGCTEGCRFCQAGMIYRPVRERKPEDIIDAVLEGTDAAGFDETSLTALSTADVSCIDPLIKALVPKLVERKVSLGIASLRAYGLGESMLDEIKRVGIDGLTFAPEAGTQRMRDVINKNVSDADIMTSAQRIFERGYDRMKMYFIMGLPTETETDVVGIIETGAEVRRLALRVARQRNSSRVAQVTVSVSQHVPKPHTPFQWAAMDCMADLESKVALLRSLSKRAKVDLKTHDVRESWLECLFARGDRRMGEALEIAYRKGARFDGWKEHFDFDTWLEALDEAGIEPDRYTQTLPLETPLPWTHLDVGLEPGFLESEYRKSLKGRVSPPCGKPAGAKVHHRDLETAKADPKRLVCYDCGIACDLSEMRDDRIEALRALEHVEPETATPSETAPAFVSVDRLQGRLPKSVLADDNAFKEGAEAPYSKVRIFFAKRGSLVFLGHLDFARLLPRMLRRAKVEVGFSRGFNPQPRMSFGPALPLGMEADEEAVDVDLLLDCSVRHMLDEVEGDERAGIELDLRDRLALVAPPGLEVIDVRLVGPREKRLGEVVAGADYVARLPGDQPLDEVAATLERVLQRDSLIVQRERKKKKRRKRDKKRISSGSETVAIDLGAQLEGVRLEREAGCLHFRIRNEREGPTARPREAVLTLLGRSLDDGRIRRTRLLGHGSSGELTSLRELGACPRPAT